MLFFSIFFLPLFIWAVVDYWSDDFDVTKNCKQEETMKTLNHEESCAITQHGKQKFEAFLNPYITHKLCV